MQLTNLTAPKRPLTLDEHRSDVEKILRKKLREVHTDETKGDDAKTTIAWKLHRWLDGLAYP